MELASLLPPWLLPPWLPTMVVVPLDVFERQSKCPLSAAEKVGEWVGAAVGDGVGEGVGAAVGERVGAGRRMK